MAIKGFTTPLTTYRTTSGGGTTAAATNTSAISYFNTYSTKQITLQQQLATETDPVIRAQIQAQLDISTEILRDLGNALRREQALVKEMAKIANANPSKYVKPEVVVNQIIGIAKNALR